MTLKQFLRQDFNTKIRPFLIKSTCEVCGSDTEQLHLHHVTYFQDLLNETLAELQLEFHDEDYEQHYTENQLEMIRNIMLGKQMRIEYVTCCESCHLELHDGSYCPPKKGKRKEWSEKMVVINKERKKMRGLQKQQRMEREVKPYLESVIGEKFVTPEQKGYLAEFCGCRDKQGRLVKTPKAISKVLAEYGIGYEIKTKKTNKRVEGKVVAVNYWMVNKL